MSASLAATTPPPPSTPENNTNTPRRMALQRSFTTPCKPAASPWTNPTAAIGEAKGIETLYTHPSARVIKFFTASSSRPSSSTGRASFTASRGAEGETGTLSWASPTERTMAAGPLEIYRVPGSVSFLHSGSLLHPILPRSQCWCVDGASKFALRVLPDTYYRIELPGATDEELRQVEALKVTLAKVLFYERTPCPFKRSFSVDLPEENAEKVKKGRRKSTGPAKRWKLDRAYSWKPEDGGEARERRDSVSSSESGEDSETPPEPETEPTRQESSPAQDVRQTVLETPTRPRGLAGSRSITAPPQFILRTALPPTLPRSIAALDGVSEEGPAQTVEPIQREEQLTGSVAVLRSFQSIPTAMPPSPPDSSAGIEYITTAGIRDDVAEDRAESRGVHSPQQDDAADVLVGQQLAQSGAAPLREEVMGEEVEESAYAGLTFEHAEILASIETTAAPRIGPEAEESVYGGMSFDECVRALHEGRPVAPSPTSTQATLQSELAPPLPAADAVLAAQDPEDEDPADTTFEQRVRALHESNPAPKPTVLEPPSERIDNNARIAAPAPAEPELARDPPASLTFEERVRALHDGTRPASVPPAASAPAHTAPPLPSASAHTPALSRDPLAPRLPSFHARTLASARPPSPSRHSSAASSTSRSSRSSGASSVSRRSRRAEAHFAAALVRRTCSIMLGPPAYLVALMLKIAARFASGTFGFASPAGRPRTVPGSWDLAGEVGSEGESELEREDDYGVPIRSPVRLMKGLRGRERRCWELD